MKPCDNCRSHILPNTTHEPTRDEIGGGICTVHYTPAKPHLRLQYNPTPTHPDSACHWRVEYVRGPSHKARRATYFHTTSNGALHSARVIWWGVSL